MKLSLAWIFDHIAADMSHYGVEEVVARLNASTAEIEHWYELIIPVDRFFCAKILAIGQTNIELEIPELNQKVSLDKRSDAMIGNYYLLYKQENKFRWLALKDIQSAKEGLMPAVHIPENMVNGSWRSSIPARDYILLLDNKSITHRPDLWSHRGFAREICALFDLTLRSEDYFLAQKPVKHEERAFKHNGSLPIDVRIETPLCDRLAVYHISHIAARPCEAAMAVRLAAIDARPISALVDATNYVMYDWGQPMHAFDAAQVTGALVAKNGHDGEPLTLLDNETIELRSLDCVIADQKKALSLAGIMGGKDSGVTPATQSLYIEAAHFDPTAIRLTAAHFKKRTDSSARFEKNLDPNQNTQALLRYLTLLRTMNIAYQGSDAIISLGTLAKERTITLKQQFITERMGMPISEETVHTILKKLGFGVTYDKTHNHHTITIPTFRVHKDIAFAEDLLEEIARIYGYKNITPKYVQKACKPFSLQALERKHTIKELCAFVLKAHEAYNYALYDEDWLKVLKFEPQSCVYLKNPLSESRTRLVTSLLPHLLKNMVDNQNKMDTSLQFFEMNKVWKLLSPEQIEEKTMLSLACMQTEETCSFYDYKEKLSELFYDLGMLVAWKKPTQVPPLFSRYQTAQLVLNDQVIGYAGFGKPSVVETVLRQPVFFVELDVTILLDHQLKKKGYELISKYQPVTFDISILAPYTVLVEQIEEALAHIDPRIKEVTIKDYFENPEWKDKRSITIRALVIDDLKTLTRQEIEELVSAAHEALRGLGAEIR